MRFLLCLLLLPTALASAQSPDALTADAVSHLQQQFKEERSYTFLDSEHDHSFIDGKFNQDRTTLSETIELEGAPYTRTLQIDGKPLTGKALAQEEQLYEEAIRQRRSVSSLRESQRHLTHNSGIDLSRLLLDFTPRTVGHETIDGHNCVLLLFEPKPGIQPPPTAKHTMFVDIATHEVLRYDHELIAQEGRNLAGSRVSIRFSAINGVLLPQQVTADMTWDEPKLGNRRMHLIAVHTYSNYKRFHATITIGPANVVPPEENPK